MPITTKESSICKIAITTGLLSNPKGNGNPHIVCPIDKYINKRRNKREKTSLLQSAGVSLSASASSFSTLFSCVFLKAPYPAFSTASIIAFSLAVPSTPIEFVSKFTEQEVTPGTPKTAFSTLALHAAQLIPLTLYCSISEKFSFLQNLNYLFIL